MASRQKHSKVWLYINKKDNTRASCNTCKALTTSKGGNTSNMLATQHAITLHECKVFDTLLSDGGNSCGGASGTASSVPGKQGSQVSHTERDSDAFSVFCHALPPHVFLTLKKIIWTYLVRRYRYGNSRKQAHLPWAEQLLLTTTLIIILLMKDPYSNRPTQGGVSVLPAFRTWEPCNIKLPGSVDCNNVSDILYE